MSKARERERKHRFQMEVLENLQHAIQWHMDTTDWDSYHADSEWSAADTEALKAALVEERKRLAEKQRKAENRWRASL